MFFHEYNLIGSNTLLCFIRGSSILLQFTKDNPRIRKVENLLNFKKVASLSNDINLIKQCIIASNKLEINEKTLKFIENCLKDSKPTENQKKEVYNPYMSWIFGIRIDDIIEPLKYIKIP